MTSTDFLNYTLGIGIMVLVTLFSFALITVINLFNSIRKTSEAIKSTARDVQFVKDGFKLGMLKLMSQVLNNFILKGGEKNERR